MIMLPYIVDATMSNSLTEYVYMYKIEKLKSPMCPIKGIAEDGFGT